MLHINSFWLALTKHLGVDAIGYDSGKWLGWRQFAFWGLYEAAVLFFRLSCARHEHLPSSVYKEIAGRRVSAFSKNFVIGGQASLRGCIPVGEVRKDTGLQMPATVGVSLAANAY